MAADSDKERREKLIEKYLGEPVFLEANEEERQTRLRLLVVSTLSIFITVADLHIRPGSSVLGLQIENLTDVVVRGGLLVITSYLLFHFCWIGNDRFVEWRLRLTGMNITKSTPPHTTSYGDIGKHDYVFPDLGRNSTLYLWWKNERKAVANLKELFREVFGEIPPASPNRAHQPGSLGQLDMGIKRLCTIMESPRIPVSLGRFDSWIRYFNRSQNWRYLIFDFGMPTVTGVAAIVLLLWSLLARSPAILGSPCCTYS